MESVSNLMSHFNDVIRMVARDMSVAGYTIPAEEHIITDTLYNGIPQSRPRLVAIFIRKDTLKREFVPPARLDHVVKLPELCRVTLLNEDGNAISTRFFDKGEHSVIKYPDEVHAWAQDEFRKLKLRQAHLLGVKHAEVDAGEAEPPGPRWPARSKL